MNVVEPILFQCKLNPFATAICISGSKHGSITYGTLEAFIHNVARTALKSGIVPGNIVATYINDTVLHVALVLGLMHAGATTMSLRGTMRVAGITPDVILSDHPCDFPGAGIVLPVDHRWLEGDGATVPVIPHRSENSVCSIILTSNLTGVPKGIAFSHRSLTARIAQYVYSSGSRFSHCSRLFCDFGISTSTGFHYMMCLLGRGGTIFFLGPDPADILQTFGLFKIGGMVTSPYGLGEFLKFFESDSALEVTFDHIICQGTMLSRQLSQRARARMCQNLNNCYGSTETTTVAFGPTSLLEKIPGAVGYIQPGVVVDAIDSSGNVLPPQRDGTLRIRSECMADGYVGDSDTTQAYFHDGYFYSGDIGHLTPDGILVITDWDTTVLNIGGDALSPEFVEDVIGAFPNVRESGVFATNNELGIAELTVLIVVTLPIDETALRRYCAQMLSPPFIPVRVFVVDALPRGEKGKLDRQRLAEIAVAMIKAA